jgi:hypothetical protein
MAMDYMTLFRHGYQPSSTMQPFHGPSNGHQGYPYLYTNNELYMFAQLEHHRAMIGQGKKPPPKHCTDSKPRLAKDEVDLLEREFQKNPKPSSARKREIAGLLKVDHPRINVGHQCFSFRWS